MSTFDGPRTSARKLIPSPAMLVALLALTVALSGTAYAAVTINGKNIKKGTVSSKQIKNNSVTGTDIKSQTVAASDIKDATITAGKLASGVIPTYVPTPIASASNTTDFVVEGLFGNVNVPGMSVSYTVPAGANKILAQFTSECATSTTADSQSVVARIIVDDVATGVDYETFCGPGDEDGAANSGSGGDTVYNTGVITRVIDAAPGAHTVKVQAVQGLAITAVLDAKVLTVTSGS